jgi:hypothetical protein
MNEETPAWDDTFIFLVVDSSREEAKTNCDAMRADSEFQEVIKSEQANKTTEKVDVTYMRPTDFSRMKQCRLGFDSSPRSSSMSAEP